MTTLALLPGSTPFSPANGRTTRFLSEFGHWLVFFFASVGGVAVAPAQTDPSHEFIVRAWRMEQGLPHNTIQAILQTRDGYLWVATDAGLARFDGVRFTSFTRFNTPAMKSDNCLCLAEDSEGSLWIGTADGLLRLRQHRFRYYSVADGLADEDVLSLCADQAGGLWIGTKTGLVRFQSEKLTAYANPDGPAHSEIHKLHIDSSGVLWIGSLSGLQWMLPDSMEAKFVDKTDTELNMPVLGMQGDRQGALWVIYHGKHNAGPPPPPDSLGWLYRCEHRANVAASTELISQRHFSPDSQFLLLDRSDWLWLPGEAGGSVVFGEGKFIEYSLPLVGLQDRVSCLYEDREGNIWVGTAKSGLQQWHPRSFRVYTTVDGLANDDVFAVYEASDGALWFASDDAATRLKQNEWSKFATPDRLPGDRVTSVAQVAFGGVWMGTSDGLCKFENGVWVKHRFRGEWWENKIRAILSTGDGSMWVATAGGLSHIQGENRFKYTVAEGFGHNNISTLLQDGRGTLWIGTWGGGLQSLLDGRLQRSLRPMVYRTILFLRSIRMPTERFGSAQIAV